MSTVSSDYLAKIRFAVRRNENTLMDSELTDIILQCRADLIRVGVGSTIAENETNQLVLGCVRAFARWQTGGGGSDPELSHQDYLTMADDLRCSSDKYIT